ncbi:MAG: hypothetical protein ABIZ91_15370 [Gemmatimonadaceae bacterium]
MNLLVAFAFSFPPCLPARDAWFARDKVKHFLAAAAIQGISYAAFRQRTDHPTVALWGATGVTAAASLGKEWHDRRSGRTFSVRDLAWDAAGTGAATIGIIRFRDR